ncbi:arginine/serine-rich protein PNISR-like isoform X2 [Artemia franciscana]|uniref:arginine/serine-rich protein PNISR-like isoform X2 n=1 Tax=Artemia franciscana TaxID=6661 RepID=UPI0032DAAB62
MSRTPDVEEGELEDDDTGQPESQQEKLADEKLEAVVNKNELKEDVNTDNRIHKLNISSFGSESHFKSTISNQNVLTTEEEEFLKRTTSDAHLLVSKPDDIDPQLKQFGLPSTFRSSRGIERGGYRGRRPFRSRGFFPFNNFRGKYNYQRNNDVKQHSLYTRDRSLTPNKFHKRRRSPSPSPRRTPKYQRRSDSIRKSRHRRRSVTSSSRSRSRSRSRKSRKKQRSRSRTPEPNGISSLRKRWITSHSARKHGQDKINKNSISSSSSYSSSSSSDSEEDRRKKSRYRQEKDSKRQKTDNVLQTSTKEMEPSNDGVTLKETTVYGSVQQNIVQYDSVQQNIETIPMPPLIESKAPMKSDMPQAEQIDSIVKSVPYAPQELLTAVSKKPRTPPSEPVKVPDESSSSFMLKEAVDHSKLDTNLSPVKKKKKRRPKTPPSPPPYESTVMRNGKLESPKRGLPPFDEHTVVTPSDGPFGMLLIGLTRCVVKSDEDAQIALYVASSLTRALAEYHRQLNHEENDMENQDSTSKAEDPVFQDLVAKSLPQLQDFQSIYQKTRGNEEIPCLLENKIKPIIDIHSEVATLFNTEESNEQSFEKLDTNLNTVPSSPSSSGHLAWMEECLESKHKSLPKLEVGKSQIDPTTIRSRVSAVWEPLFKDDK